MTNNIAEQVDQLRLVDLNNARLRGDNAKESEIRDKIKLLNSIRWRELDTHPGDDMIPIDRVNN